MAPTPMKLRVRRRDNAAEAECAEPEHNRDTRSRRKKNTRKTKMDALSTPPPPRVPTEEASPDSKCPICLDRFNNLAYLDRCLHRFCFPCIQEWSHNKAECPLCKQPFASILHSVRAEDDFKEYTLRPPPDSVAATVAMVAALASTTGSEHHMRLMLRRHRLPEREEPMRRGRRRGVWEWYLDTPANRYGFTDVGMEDLHTVRAQGLVLQSVSRRGSAALAQRLRKRRQRQVDGTVPPRPCERETVELRRELYRYNVQVRGVAGVTNEQPQRDITAEGFRQTPANLRRVRAWLRRELVVLYSGHNAVTKTAQRIVLAQLARHGLEDTSTLEDELRPVMIGRTGHFLHELQNFARSPLSMDVYDAQALYDPPAVRGGSSPSILVLEGRSPLSPDSSVIAISEGEEGSGPNGQTGSTLSLSGWDDETPGPSYSTAEPSGSMLLSSDTQEPANQEEECLIVGYKKPMAERTPELVQLSSDSEEEKDPPPLRLPTSPASTSAPPNGEPDAAQEEAAPLPTHLLSCSSGESRKSLCSLSPAPAKRKSTLCDPTFSPYSPTFDWDLGRISPVSSSITSSPPLYSSPSPTPQTPPTPSLSPNEHHGEKPSGKRKYKSRHLDNQAKDPLWRPSGSHDDRKRKKRGRDKRRGGERGIAGERRSRNDRSPSVEIIYEGTISSAQPPKRRRKRHREPRPTSSPVIITLDSDSCHDDVTQKITAGCSDSLFDDLPIDVEKLEDEEGVTEATENLSDRNLLASILCDMHWLAGQNPPPLKHKDSVSPLQLPAQPSDPPALIGPAIPPISTLKSHFSLSPRAEEPSTSGDPPHPSDKPSTCSSESQDPAYQSGDASMADTAPGSSSKKQILLNRVRSDPPQLHPKRPKSLSDLPEIPIPLSDRPKTPTFSFDLLHDNLSPAPPLSGRSDPFSSLTEEVKAPERPGPLSACPEKAMSLLDLFNEDPDPPSNLSDKNNPLSNLTEELHNLTRPGLPSDCPEKATPPVDLLPSELKEKMAPPTNRPDTPTFLSCPPSVSPPACSLITSQPGPSP